MLWYIIAGVMAILMLAELVCLYYTVEKAGTIMDKCQARIHVLKAEIKAMEEVIREKDRIIARHEKAAVMREIGGADNG
jgi:hypothetical protein